MLERVEKKGLIASLLGEPMAERGSNARTYFKPTTDELESLCMPAHDDGHHDVFAPLAYIKPGYLGVA